MNDGDVVSILIAVAVIGAFLFLAFVIPTSFGIQALCEEKCTTWFEDHPEEEECVCYTKDHRNGWIMEEYITYDNLDLHIHEGDVSV